MNTSNFFSFLLLISFLSVVTINHLDYEFQYSEPSQRFFYVVSTDANKSIVGETIITSGTYPNNKSITNNISKFPGIEPPIVITNIIEMTRTDYNNFVENKSK